MFRVTADLHNLVAFYPHDDAACSRADAAIGALLTAPPEWHGLLGGPRPELSVELAIVGHQGRFCGAGRRRATSTWARRAPGDVIGTTFSFTAASLAPSAAYVDHAE